LAELAVISLPKLRTGGKIWRWGLNPKQVGGETQAATAAQFTQRLQLDTRATGLAVTAQAKLKVWRWFWRLAVSKLVFKKAQN
jgi:hypothetical protein